MYNRTWTALDTIILFILFNYYGYFYGKRIFNSKNLSAHSVFLSPPLPPLLFFVSSFFLYRLNNLCSMFWICPMKPFFLACRARKFQQHFCCGRLHLHGSQVAGRTSYWGYDSSWVGSDLCLELSSNKVALIAKCCQPLPYNVKAYYIFGIN